ncbi:MAG: hypothetical protein RIG61_02140 [Deltaproteobacteria bacterium]
MTPFVAASVEWKLLGYGTLDDSARFDVFVDTETIRDLNGNIRFWEGHVFYSEQPLPSGGSYLRVSILRIVHCGEKSDSDLEAVFYGSDGSVVDRFAARGAGGLKPVDAGTIRGAVLEFVCDYQRDGGM